MTLNYYLESEFDWARKLQPTIVIWDNPKLQNTIVIFNFFKLQPIIKILNDQKMPPTISILNGLNLMFIMVFFNDPITDPQP